MKTVAVFFIDTGKMVILPLIIILISTINTVVFSIPIDHYLLKKSNAEIGSFILITDFFNSPDRQENPFPNYYYEISDDEICDGELVIFTHYFSGTPPWTVDYLLNDMPASFTTSENPYISSEELIQTSYYDPLTVTDGAGNSNPVFQPSLITVDALPELTWEVSETEVCHGDMVYFILSFTGYPPWSFHYLVNGEPFTEIHWESPALLSREILHNTLFIFDSLSDEKGCGSDISEEVTIAVRQHPEITCPDTLQVYHSDPPVLLDYATPKGGIYSGSSVFMEGGQYFFDPLTCPGDYHILYCYEDSQSGCISCCSFNIRVLLPDDLQIIQLSQGWSGVSCYLAPYHDQLEDIFASMIPEINLEIMIGENGVFWPGQNINTLHQWNVYQGYKLKMNHPGCLKITGSCPINKTVTIKKGATYIPVLCRQPVPAGQIMSQLGSNLIFAIDIKTMQLYWPAGGIYTLDFLNPGTSYLVNLLHSSGITYDCSETVLKTAPESITEPLPDAPWECNKTTLFHLISLDNLTYEELEPGDYIGVFNNAGFCCGMSQYTGKNEHLHVIAFGKDENEPGVAGLNTGDPMFFRIFDTTTKREYELVPTFDPGLPDAGCFTEYGQTGIIKAEINDQNYFNDLTGIKFTTHPVTGETMITFNGISGLATLEIITLAGQTVYKDFYNEAEKENYILNTYNIPSGIYIIKIQCGTAAQTAKLLIK